MQERGSKRKANKMFLLMIALYDIDGNSEKEPNIPRILDGEGEEVWLGIKRGERRVWRDVKVKGNVAGYWGDGFTEPAFVFTNMDPEEGLELYRGRMKIEEMFRDAKGLLGLGKVMTKGRRNLEALIGLMLLAYAVGLMIGEVVREEVYRSKIFIFLKYRLRLR
ncbi:MAG: transposase [Thermaceae bacterium]